MAPITKASDEATHQALLDQLDIFSIPKPFKNPNWKPPQRRNKSVKQIQSEASRNQASVLATQTNSGASTPALQNTTGTATPSNGTLLPPNIAQAAQSLDRLVLEKNLAAATNGGIVAGPSVTYASVEAAPSLKPSKRYCDITGLKAPYRDPKTGLLYHDKEVFAYLKTMGQGTVEQHLAARNAHTVLK